MSNKSIYTINNNIAKARTLHSSYYTSHDIFKNSVEKIFSSSWQLIADSNQLKNNNIVPITFLADTLAEPLLLTKDKEKIKCISNVCTHRGHLVCSEDKMGKSLTCRYHGRTFKLDGKLKKAIGFEGAERFPADSDNLHNINIREWNDFIFISLNNKINNLSVLNDIDRRLKDFPFNKIKYSKELSSSFMIDTHWAMYCENYLEGFHVPFVHKGLSNEIDNESYETEILNNGVLQHAAGKNSKDVYGYYYWIFPNIILNFYSWGLSLNIVEPISIDKTRVRFISFPIENKDKPTKEISNIIRVEREDQSVVQSVCKGVQSRYYDSGRFSPKHEKGVHYFHQLLSKFI